MVHGFFFLRFSRLYFLIILSTPTMVESSRVSRISLAASTVRICSSLVGVQICTGRSVGPAHIGAAFCWVYEYIPHGAYMMWRAKGKKGLVFFSKRKPLKSPEVIAEGPMSCLSVFFLLTGWALVSGKDSNRSLLYADNTCVNWCAQELLTRVAASSDEGEMSLVRRVFT